MMKGRKSKESAVRVGVRWRRGGGGKKRVGTVKRVGAEVEKRSGMGKRKSGGGWKSVGVERMVEETRL